MFHNISCYNISSTFFYIILFYIILFISYISENRLIILDITNPLESKKRKFEEAIITLSPLVEMCGNCNSEFFSEQSIFRQTNLSGTNKATLLWLINVICAHKLLKFHD